MRVLLCDDHAVFADSLAFVLRHAGHDVVGVVYSPDAALRLLHDVRADVCLIDLTFPAGSVLGRLPELTAAAPATRFVVLSADTAPETAEAVLAAGARGFAHKSGRLGDIVDLLRQVDAGGVVVGPAPAGTARSRPRTDAQRLARHLTPREREVLSRLVRGENVAGLVLTMRISRSTARSHVQSVLTKLGVHSQREAVITAARHGLISITTGEWLVP